MTGKLLIYHFLFSAPASPKAAAEVLLDLCVQSELRHSGGSHLAQVQTPTLTYLLVGFCFAF